MRPIALVLLLLMTPLGARGQANPTPVATAEKKDAADGHQGPWHWTIEIRNPDGTLDSVGRSKTRSSVWTPEADPAGRVFWRTTTRIPSGSLTCTDRTAAARPLASAVTIGSPNPWPCSMRSSRGLPSPEPRSYKNLGRRATAPGRPATQTEGTVELSGSATAALDGSHRAVASQWFVTSRNHFRRFHVQVADPCHRGPRGPDHPGQGRLQLHLIRTARGEAMSARNRTGPHPRPFGRKHWPPSRGGGGRRSHRRRMARRLPWRCGRHSIDTPVDVAVLANDSDPTAIP
jgi:hypothetical protein